MKKYLRCVKRGLTKAVNELPVSSKIIGTPRRCNTTFAYASQHPPALVSRLAEEEKLDFPIVQLNRPEFASAFIRSRKTKSQYILLLSKGRVWGSNGAVITAEDVFLSDVSREFKLKNPCTDHSVFHNVFLNKAIEISGTAAVVATAGANVYYHWLLDIIPRILMLKEAGLIDKVDRFILDYEGLSFQKQALQLLNISEEKIINCHGNRKFHIEADTLLVPTLPSLLNEVNKFECMLLQKHLFLSDADFKSPRRVYITRKKTGTRTILNEAEVIAYFKTLEFEVLDLQSFTLQQQWQIFRDAEIIAGPHGSAFANIAFCKAGSVLIDILPDSNIVPCFYNLAVQMGVRYYGYIDKGVAMNGDHKNDNIQIDLEAFYIFFNTYIST